MNRRRRNDAQIIAESLTHLDALKAHLRQGDLANQTIMDAVCMRLSAAIEALNKGEPALGRRLFGDDWNDMWATRNHIAHGYVFIDLSIIAATVENDLPEFERVLREAAG